MPDSWRHPLPEWYYDSTDPPKIIGSASTSIAQNVFGSAISGALKNPIGLAIIAAIVYTYVRRR